MQSRAFAAAPEEQLLIVYRWVSGLRWCVFVLMAGALVVGDLFLEQPVNRSVAALVLAAVVAANVFVALRVRPTTAASPRWMGLAVAFDLVALGALLAVGGGAANPFSALFFVYVALAASLLPARTAAALVALAALVFASLFMLPVGACCPNHPTHGAFSAHLYGMLFAFVLGAGLVTYFLANVRRALDRRADEIAELRAQAEQGVRFAALGTLAAGTAHELNTPLATIYVLASELTERGASADEAAEVGGRIRRQVERCREVLTRLQGAASEPRASDPTDLGGAVDQAVSAWRQAHPGVEVTVERRGDGAREVSLTPEEVSAALGVLLDNALFATRAAGAPRPIHISVEEGAGGTRVRVSDGGSGVDPSLVERLGEPFVTTKEPGEGMGLGLFWVRSMLKRVGGRLSVESARSGTTVTLDLTASAAGGSS